MPVQTGANQIIIPPQNRNVGVFDTACEAFGADPGKTAAQNYSAIQAALNQTGRVTLMTPGVFTINDTLYIQSNTNFVLGRGVTLKMAPGPKKRMLACASSLLSPQPVTVAWTTDNNIATVTWANHGLTHQDYVCLQGAQLTGTVTGATQANPCVITSNGHNLQTGDRVTFNDDVGGMTQLRGNSYVVTRVSANTFSLSSLTATTDSTGFSAFTSGGTWFSIQGEYNNVFRVFEVLTANTFTVSMYETPTASPGGSMTAVACTRSFSVEGGTWDYDVATNEGVVSELNRHAIAMHFAADFRAADIKCINVAKFGFNTMACADYVCERIGATNVAEVFKHYGPAANGRVTGIFGDSVDDSTTVQMREPQTFIANQPAQGDIVNLTIQDVNVRNVGGASSGAVVVYASNHDKCVGLTFENIISKATVAPAFRIRNGDLFTVGAIQEVALIDAVLSGKATANYAILVDSVEVKNFKLTRPKFVPADATSPFFSTNAAANIENMLVEDMGFYNEVYPTPGGGMFVLNGVMGRFAAERCDIRGGAGMTFVSVPASQSIGNVILRDSRFEGLSVVADIRSLSNVYRENCTFNSIPNGALRIQSGTGLMARVFGAGRNTYATASHAIVILSPSTAEVYDWDLRIDPIALTQLATTDGQFCSSTQAGVEGGVCTRTPAGWVALGTGAGGVNTVIT
jgi:hypothetical protein